MTTRAATLGALVMLVAVLPATAPVPQSEHALEIGRPFPTIPLPDLEGTRRSVADFRGHRLILHVFASW